MTEKELKNYIRLINSGKYEERIFLRQISSNVYFSKVWKTLPKVTDPARCFTDSYRIFFIKDDSDGFIGAVLDMVNDLHWFISPRHRKKGHLTKALKKAILPYLFNEGREIQVVTISDDEICDKNYQNSKRVALNLGFKEMDNNEFVLTKDSFDSSEDEHMEIDTKLHQERLDILKKRISYASRILYKISDELKMAADNDVDLFSTAKVVENYTFKIDDIFWEEQ